MKPQLAKLAKQIAAAKPTTESAFWKFIRTSIIPRLPDVLPFIIERASKRTKGYLRKTRDILNNSNLEDEVEE